MTDNDIIKMLKCCLISHSCLNCPIDTDAPKPRGCNDLGALLLDLINRQKAKIEELNECYTNLSNASLQHSIDNAKDRELLSEYQNIFLDLGYGVEVSDPELKEIKAWKDRMIWHCKRTDELLTENSKLKEELEEKSNRLREVLPIVAELKSEAIKEFAEKLKRNAVTMQTVEGYSYNAITRAGIDFFEKQMTEDI